MKFHFKIAANLAVFDNFVAGLQGDLQPFCQVFSSKMYNNESIPYFPSINLTIIMYEDIEEALTQPQPSRNFFKYLATVDGRSILFAPFQ